MSLRPSRPGDAESDLHRAVARLSVNDIERLGATSDYRAAQDPDGQLAFRLAIEEARILESFQRDRALALSAYLDQEEDGPNLPATRIPAIRPTPMVGSSRMATSQLRNTLVRFTRQPANAATPVPAARNLPTTTASHPVRARGFFRSVINWFKGSSSASIPLSFQPLSSISTDDIRGTANRLTGHDCVTCMDPIRGVEIRTPCGHYYDKSCMIELFEAATQDESLFPPRCCRQQIPLASVSLHMTSTILATFRDKSKEFGTKKRVYCAKPSCSRFLGAQNEGSLAILSAPAFRCPAPGCNTTTCSSCKNALAPGVVHRCDTNEADRRVLAMGQESGWARCPGCETMIELNMGCYHMTCRCRTEFCYLCRARWKSCVCPQWDERRLLVAAEARADAEIRLGAVGRVAPQPAAPPARAVVRAAPGPPLPPRPVGRGVPTRTTLSRPAQVTTPGPPLPPRPEGRGVPTRTSTLPRPVQVTAARPTTPSSGVTRSAPLRATTNDGRGLRGDSTSARPLSVTSCPSSTITSTGGCSTDRHRPSFYIDFTSPAKPEGQDARPLRDTLVRQWMDRLRVDHDCDHGSWRYRRGSGMCEVCHHHLPLYLFRCNGCAMMACKRCRFNRL